MSKWGTANPHDSCNLLWMAVHVTGTPVPNSVRPVRLGQQALQCTFEEALHLAYVDNWPDDLREAYEQAAKHGDWAERGDIAIRLIDRFTDVDTEGLQEDHDG